MPADDFPPGLSIREQQVLSMVREGRVDGEIAVRLGLGAGEVKQTVAVLVSKLGVRDRAGLVTWSPGPRGSRESSFVERLADRMGATAGGLLLAAILIIALLLALVRFLDDGSDDPVDLRESVRTVVAQATSTPTPP